MKTISKKLFVSTIKAIEKQYDFDRVCADKIQSVFSDAWITGYDNHILNNALVELLSYLIEDEKKNSWIEYFIFELDFGKNWKPGTVTEDDKDIRLQTASDLYDMLIKK